MIRRAFYKHNKKFIDRAISSYTWLWNMGTPPYSHEEIGFYVVKEGDRYVPTEVGDSKGRWVYFSSTMRNRASGIKKSNGTRWINEVELLKHRSRWDVYEQPSHRNVSDMINQAMLLEDKDYDFYGIFGFATIFGLINSFNSWYCSEVCQYIDSGLWVRRISPRRDYKNNQKRLILLCPSL